MVPAAAEENGGGRLSDSFLMEGRSGSGGHFDRLSLEVFSEATGVAGADGGRAGMLPPSLPPPLRTSMELSLRAACSKALQSSEGLLLALLLAPSCLKLSAFSGDAALQGTTPQGST